MHKSTRFTLTSTALLGIMLYAVVRFTDDLQNAPVQQPVQVIGGDVAPAVAAPQALKTPPAPDPRLPRITTHAELIAHLDDAGHNSRLLVDQAAGWYGARGFLGVNELLGVTVDNSPAAYYETFDLPTLRAMSEGGDAGATQTLAHTAMFSDPFRALELYRKAVSQGSVYAGIKIADSLSFFADIRRGGDRNFQRQIRELQRASPTEIRGHNLRIETYATLLATMGDGGPPIIDTELLDWSTSFESKIVPAGLDRACRRSAEIVAENGAARRENGFAPLSTQPPPVFLSPPDLEMRMPCAATGYPVVAMMDLSNCTTESVIGPDGTESLLHICPR
jgi:hypothetical protein